MIQTDLILEPKELLAVLRAGQRLDFKALLRTQPETVVDAAFEEANFEERLEFLRLMPVERAANGFTDLPMPEQVAVISALAPDRIRVMGAYIGPDEIADLLQEIGDPETREYLLSALPKTLAASALELLQYNEDDAGGMMTPEFIALKEGWTAQHALSFLRQAAEHAETVSNLFLVDALGRLTGVIPLHALVTAPGNTRVDDLAQRDIISAKTDTDQEDVARLMRDYDLSVMPIVDSEGVLKGIVTIDDVVDVIQEEATEDFYKGAAMEGSEIDYLRTNPFELWRKRVFWLMALSISEFLTVNVTRNFEGLIAQQAILSSFIAALIGTGGNTGSQSAVLIIRAISLGQLRGRDSLKIFTKELTTGALLGSTLSVLAYVRVKFFYPEAGDAIALTVASSILLIVLSANIIGAMLPLAFHKLKIDPALTSSPFIATIMDATGLLIYFNIAKLLLGM